MKCAACASVVPRGLRRQLPLPGRSIASQNAAHSGRYAAIRSRSPASSPTAAGSCVDVVHAGQAAAEVLDVVRELVRRVAEAAVLEVDQPHPPVVEQDVGRVEVGDPEGGEPRLGQRRGGDEVPCVGQGVRHQRRVAARLEVGLVGEPLDEHARKGVRAVPPRPDPGGRHRLDRHVVQPAQRRPQRSGLPVVIGRGARVSPGTRDITTTGRSPSSRRRGRGARPRRVLGEERQAGPLALGPRLVSGDELLADLLGADRQVVGGGLHPRNLAVCSVDTMRVTIIGGHGKIALLLAPLLVDAGHEVTSVIRNPDHVADVEATGATALVSVGGGRRHPRPGRSAVRAGRRRLVGRRGRRRPAAHLRGRPRRRDPLDGRGADRRRRALRDGVLLRRRPRLPRPGGQPVPVLPGRQDRRRRAPSRVGLDWTVLGPGSLTLEPGRGAVNPHARSGEGDTTSRELVAQVALAVLDDPRAHRKTLVFGDGDVPIDEWLASL